MACAGSNIAVDNMAEKLVNSKMKICRIGKPARVLPKIIDHSLDSLIHHHPTFKAMIREKKLAETKILHKLQKSKNKKKYDLRK